MENTEFTVDKIPTMFSGTIELRFSFAFRKKELFHK